MSGNEYLLKGTVEEKRGYRLGIFFVFSHSGADLDRSRMVDECLSSLACLSPGIGDWPNQLCAVVLSSLEVLN